MDDARLAGRAKHGDVAAFEDLVDRYQALAFRAAYLFTGDRADAEDVTQEAFLKAYQSLDGFRPGLPFKPWLLRIVTNEAHNRRRGTGRQMRLVLREAALTIPSASSSPESSVLALELRSDVVAHVNRMSDADREIITCRYFLDLTVAEIAGVLGCPESTIRTRLSRALARLRERLSDGDATPDPDTWKRPDDA